MAQVQMPNGLYQERAALIDRIQSYDIGARLSGDVHRAGATEFTRAHIEYANARLDLVHYLIACLEEFTAT